MDSTVYRRGPDGKIIGTAESNQNAPDLATPPNSVFSVSTYSATELGANPDHNKARPKKPRESKPKSRPAGAKISNSTSKPDSEKTKKRFPRSVRYIRNVVLAYLLFYVILGFHAATSLDKISASSNVPIADTAGTNWLLAGSDSREGLSKAEQKQLHTGKDGGNQRTDTLMLIHIDENGKPTLVSLPRDSYVKIPAHIALDGSSVEDRKNKINTAYGKGGAPLLVETIELNTGLHIDHYMEVGFKGIRDITDAVGGVNMCIAEDVKDKNSGLNLKAGCQALEGKDALAYVRMRYADPKGDLGRVERQQQFLSSVMKKVATPTVLLNPIAMWKLVDAGTASVNVGSEDSVRDVAKLAIAMRALSNGKGTLTTVPISDPDATTAAGSSVLWDEEAARELFISLGAK